MKSTCFGAQSQLGTHKYAGAIRVAVGNRTRLRGRGSNALARLVRRSTLAFAAANMFAVTHPMLARAEAPPATSTLNWVRLAGTENCMAAQELSARIEARLGRRVFVPPGDAAIALEGHTELRDKRVHVALTGARRDGTTIGLRELSGDTCRELDESIVLVFALMIDPRAPLAAEAVPTPSASAKPVAATQPVAALPIESTKPAAHTQTAPVALEGYVGGGLAIAQAPSLAAAFAVGLRVLVQRLPLIEIGLRGMPTSTASIAKRSVETSAIAGEVALCPKLLGFAKHKQLYIALCFGVRAGAYSARGVGLAVNETARAWLIDINGRARAHTPLFGPLLAYLDAGLVVPLVRQQLLVRGADSAQSVQALQLRPTVGGEATLGLGVEF